MQYYYFGMMSTNTSSHILLEGLIKHRDNRKWKSRWAVVSKLSPVASCLHLELYRSCKDKLRNAPPRRVILAQDYLGIESGFTLDREANTLAILCKEVTVVLSFDTREILHQWQTKLQCHFCKEHHYLVHIVSLPPKSKLACGPARLLLQDFVFCLVSGIPPRLLGFWPLEQLRRFGSVESKFCFEGGSHCGKGIGLHVLYTNQADELSKCFELASCGQLTSLKLQTSDCHGYYRKSGESLLYKYANGKANNGAMEVHKSTSSDSSTCDSCSHILSLSIADENTRSSYYLDREGAKSAQYHSAMNLECHEVVTCANGVKVCLENGHRHDQAHESICNANSACKCHSRARSSIFGANTISRLPCSKSLTRRETVAACLTTESLKPSSPSTVSLAHSFLASDRESLFSQSSQGSSNSSSGCSSLTCTENSQPIHNRSSNQHPCLQLEIMGPLELNGRHLLQQRDDVERNGHESSDPGGSHRDKRCGHDDFIQRQLSRTETEKSSHLYSQINLISRNSERSKMANYDIPRNLCVNVPLFNQKTSQHVINHCLCDTRNRNGNEPRDSNADYSTQLHSATLLRNHAKPKDHFLQPQSDAPDSESIHHHCHHNKPSNATACPQQRIIKESNSLVGKRPDNETQTLVPRTEPNYANMEFANSIALYENLRFDTQKLACPKLAAHSPQGDESISGAGQCERQLSQRSLECVRNCSCHCDGQQQHHCQTNGADNDNALGDELRTGDERTAHSPHSDSVSGPLAPQSDACYGASVPGRENCTPAEAVSVVECVERETDACNQNGNISTGGPNETGTGKCANNGDHYRARHRAEVNISLSCSSSLHNRTSCKHQLRSSGPKDCLCSTRATKHWSIANAIRGGHSRHHSAKSSSSVRTKSYSIDDISSTVELFHTRTASRDDSYANREVESTLCRKHKSDEVLSAAKRRLTSLNQDRVLDSNPCSDSESEDFCTSSQITVLYHNQTE